MPRTRSLAWSELKIGVLTIIAVGIAVLTIFLLTGSRGFFWDRYKLKTQFKTVAGLKSGSPVMVAGVEKGVVTDVELAGEVVDVTFEVKKDMRDRITSASRATLGSVSLLGGASVEITPALRGSPIPEWGYVPAGPAPAQFSDLATQANEGVQKISALVEDIRGGRGTVGKLMTDDQLYREMTAFMATAGAMTRGIQEGRGTIGKLINDPKVANSLETSLKSVEEMTRRLNAGEGSLGKLMTDDAFSRTLTEATSNLKELTGTLNQVSGRLDRGEGTAGKLLTDPALFNRLNSTSERFDQLVARLNDGQGTIGQLLKDRQLYENMNGAVSELRALVAEIRKDPKKYLNMKISIF
jgi:phospholipid/cholesterol/gamma-HCH transport system substrate-binding protein